METSNNFLIIFTFMFLQRFGAISSNNVTMNVTKTSPKPVTCIARERDSLLVFKQTLNDKFNRLSTWRGVECCEWQGIECDRQNNGHVVTLDLQNPQSSYVVGGEISPSLLNLKHLRYLDLSTNDFSGQKIPNFLGSFKYLKYLDLSYSGFGGVVPPHLGNLSNLQYLDLTSMYGSLVVDDLRWVSSLSSLKHLNLSGVFIHHDVDWFHPIINMLPSLLTLNLANCDITSAIPSVRLVNFTSLNSLDLFGNQINSTIPLWLSNLTALMYLDLFNNHFHGQIPDFLGTLSNLVYLDVSYNLLVGVLSEVHFTKLNNLTTLQLSSNPSLAFNVSSQWIPPFQLQHFLASSCNIGPPFPNWLQTQTNLHSLYLSESNIRDTLPVWFENLLFHISDLDLSHNQIYGKLPPFQGSNLKRYMMKNSNKLDGSLTSFPKNVEVLDLSDNLLSGHVPPTDGKLNPSLKVVILSKNRFTGSFPEHFCKVLSINVLDLSQNKFSGRLPQCLGNLNKLQVMDLANNTITGDVPSSLGSLKYLWSLHLGNNRLHGDLPVSLQNLTSLQTMDLGNNLLRGNVPFWIGEKLSELKYLNLESNKFTGNIPLQLCHLNTRQLLNLAHNNLSGTIPHCFGNLTGMIMNDNQFIFYGTYEENILASMKGLQLRYTSTIRFLTSLDLSSNNIIGEIPHVLMNLVALNNLNLSRNQLKGQIPLKIGNLKEIESLDLSMNKLSGRIPQSLTTLQHISYLNLSFNNLSGVIPIGNQIQTLDDPSIYEGNNGLCGPLESSSCTGNNASSNHVDGDEGQDDLEDLRFCSGMGFVVGFMGLINSLYFNRTWRLAYYGFLENVYNWLVVLILVNLARIKRKFV